MKNLIMPLLRALRDEPGTTAKVWQRNRTSVGVVSPGISCWQPVVTGVATGAFRFWDWYCHQWQSGSLGFIGTPISRIYWDIHLKIYWDTHLNGL